jgi:hypothetical protein
VSGSSLGKGGPKATLGFSATTISAIIAPKRKSVRARPRRRRCLEGGP